MAMKLATAYVDITAKDAGFKRGMQDMRSEVESQTKGLASMLGQLGVGAAIGGMVGGALKIASAAESSETAFNVMIKDLDKTKQLLSDLNKFSVVTPFEPGQVRAAGQALLAFKTSVEDIPPTLQMLGDISAGSGKDLQEIVMVFNKIKAAGKLTGETFLQLAERSVNMQDILTEQLGVSADEFKKMQAAGKISFDDVVKGMQSMTGEGGMFFQAMQKQSQTAAGLWSTLVGGIKMAAENFGKVLLPAWKSVLGVAIQFVDWIAKVNENTGGMINQIVAATAAIGGLTVAFMAAKTAAQLMGLTFKKVLIATGWGIVIVALGTIAALIYKVVSALLSSETVMSAWEQNVAKLKLAWMRFSTALSTAWEAIKAVVGGAITSIAEAWGINIGGMTESGEGFFSGLITKVSDFVLNIAQWLQVFSENWGTTWEIVKNGAMIVFQMLKDLFTINLTTIIGYSLGMQYGLMWDLVSGVAKFVFKAITKIADFMSTVFANIWNGIKNLFAGKSFGDIMKGAIGVMEKEAGDFAQAFQDGWDRKPIKLDQGEGTKKALAEQERLFAKLADRKKQLEKEDEENVKAMNTKPVEDAKKEVKKQLETPIKANVKIESGFTALDAMQKNLQEQALKGGSKDDKLVKQGEAAALSRDAMAKSLESIDTKLDTAPEKATK